MHCRIVDKLSGKPASNLQGRLLCRSHCDGTASITGVAAFYWKAEARNGKLLCVRKLVYLSLGSNVGDREANLRRGLEGLNQLGEVRAISSFYETEPVDNTRQPWFLNCAVALESEKMPKQLLSAVLNIEQEMGRRRPPKQPKGPREIDIDILLFGKSVVDTKGLTIPHPAMHQRRFVLEPLAEIAPDQRHPVFKQTIRELLDALPPGQVVRKLPG